VALRRAVIAKIDGPPAENYTGRTGGLVQTGEIVPGPGTNGFAKRAGEATRSRNFVGRVGMPRRPTISTKVPPSGLEPETR
jgi:hypothetical protein